MAPPVVVDVLEHLGGDDPVEAGIGGKGQPQRVGHGDGGAPARRSDGRVRVVGLHRRHHPARASRTIACRSASTAVTTAPRRMASKAWRPPPAPRSRRRSPRLDTEPVVADRQHAVPAARWAVDGPAVVLDGPGGARALHVKRSRTRATAGGGSAGPPAPGSSRTRPMATARAPGSPGGTRQGGLAVRCRRPRGGPRRWWRRAVHAGRHRLDRRQGEPLVQRRHDGDGGLSEHLGQPGVGDARGERDCTARGPGRSMRRGDRHRPREGDRRRPGGSPGARHAAWPPPRAEERGP